MFRYTIISLFLLLNFLATVRVQSQTLRQRSDLAYSKLSAAGGPARIPLLNEITSYRLSDSIGRAEELSRQVIRESGMLHDTYGMFRALINLGIVLYNTSRVDSSWQCFFSAQKMIPGTGISRDIEEVYYNFGRVSLVRNDPKNALVYLKLAYSYAVINSNPVMEGRCCCSMADCYKQLNKSPEVLASLDKAFNFFQLESDPWKKVGTFMALGISYRDIGQIELSTKAYLQGIKNAESVGDSVNLGYMYSNMAGLLEDPGQGDRSGTYHFRALQIFRNLGNNRGISYALNNLGQHYLALGEYPRSVRYFKEASLFKEKASDWQGACFVHCNLAELYAKTGNRSNSDQEMKSAVEYGKRAGDGLSETVILNSRGNVYAILKEHTQARDYYMQSLRKARQLKLHEFITGNLLSLSEQYQAEGNPAEALNFYKKYTATRDSLFNLESEKNISELKIRYQTEKKNLQLRELSDVKRKITARNRSLLNTLFIILGILFFLVGVSFILIRSNITIKGKLVLEWVNLQQIPIPFTDTKFSLAGSSDQASKPWLSPDQQSMLWHELNRLVEAEKMYFDSHLKLSELARRLNTNTSYLSRVINEVTEDNFCNYLNQLRIREACVVLSDPGNLNLTIEGIALSVGFNSKSAFNIAFKKYTSQTPSEFMNAAHGKVKVLA